MTEQPPIQRQFIRYTIVSIASLGINAIVFFTIYLSLIALNELLVFSLTVSILRLLAQFIAILIVTIFNFTLNRYWSFEITTREQTGRQFLKYATVGAIGTFVNLGTFAFLCDLLQLPFLASLPFSAWDDPQREFDFFFLVYKGTEVVCSSTAYLVAMVSNFILNRWWTFGQPPQAWLSFKTRYLTKGTKETRKTPEN